MPRAAPNCWPVRNNPDAAPAWATGIAAIAKAGSGRIGIFFNDSYQYYEDKWRKIDRDEVPLDWFTDYIAFTDWDI